MFASKCSLFIIRQYKIINSFLLFSQKYKIKLGMMFYVSTIRNKFPFVGLIFIFDSDHNLIAELYFSLLYPSNPTFWLLAWKDKQPAIYHGHFAFLDTTKLPVNHQANVININMIRRPIDRYVVIFTPLEYHIHNRV